jgi:hypothetical protein
MDDKNIELVQELLKHPASKVQDKVNQDESRNVKSSEMTNKESPGVTDRYIDHSGLKKQFSGRDE